MSSRHINRVIAALVAVAMLAAPTFAARAAVCGGLCCLATAKTPDTSVPTSAECCAASEHDASDQFSRLTRAARCHACCMDDDAGPPNLPAQREQNLQFIAAHAQPAVAFATPNVRISQLLVPPVSGPFWFAQDGPSRQAFLGRFAF
jgi:hypothetical protein